MSKWFKNNSGATDTWVSQQLDDQEWYEIQASEETSFANNSKMLTDIGSGDVIMATDGTGNTNITDVAEAINFLKNALPQDVTVTTQAETPPFARPDFRTKRNATAAIETCLINTTKTVDFYLAAERYVSGGIMVIKNAQFGDYVTAEVNDKDGSIPVPYRAALCENHPTVAEYIEKEFVEYIGNTYTVHRINTKPLNAKITAGLYLRITYHAVNAGSSREIVVNYDLTSKLV